MVFTTTNLFKGIACPEGESCRLTNCIFAHHLRPQSDESEPETRAVDGLEEPASKRRKITADDRTGRPWSKSDQIREQLAAERRGGAERLLLSPGLPLSLSRPVTPPPTNGKNATTNKASLCGSDNVHASNKISAKTDSQPKENLNPRLIPNDPVGHQKRTLYLRHMHMAMAVLNQSLADAKDLKDKDLLYINEQDLIKMALDEEEAMARSQGALYPNKMKQRVAAYKKMAQPDWIGHVRDTVIEPRSKDAQKGDPDEKIITTGLKPDEELLILPHLVADQKHLAQYGYINTPPTAAEAAQAQAAVEASQFYEQCERCLARFQVFPNRNEEGLLTSNGPCRFHSSRPVDPARSKDKFHYETKQKFHPCCNGVVGSTPCTEHDSHVFKTSSPARLAAVLPFITTPENTSPARDGHGTEVKAVSFDCEMGYTTHGMELIRLTAVSWPSGEELVDILVRPVGTIIDLNSRFSGVFPEHFANAVPYDEWSSSVPPPPPPPPHDGKDGPKQILPVVPSVEHARCLLCTFLTPITPLIGHAIDNDLNATRLCHPTIIDTVILYRHPRGGLPLRLPLRQLSLTYLGKRIQQGGDRGHDSAEDARATGELVRVKVGERWRQLDKDGWVIREGKLGRVDKNGGFEEVHAGGLVGSGVGGGGASKKAQKRQKGQIFGMDGAGSEVDKAEAKKEDAGGKEKNGIAAFLPRA